MDQTQRHISLSNDLSSLKEWAGTLIAKLTPYQRLSFNRKVARPAPYSGPTHRHSVQSGRYTYTAPKQRKKHQGKQGRIKRQKATIFSKLRTAANLKIRPDAIQLSVGFFGRVARIAWVYQEGLSDRVSKRGQEIYLSGPGTARV